MGLMTRRHSRVAKIQNSLEYAMNLSRASPTQRRYGSLPTSADGEAMQATIGGGEDTFLRHDDYELAEARKCVDET